MQNQKLRNTELSRLSPENFKLSEKTDIYLIVDQIRSGLNIGSIFRTADAFRVKKIFICGFSPIPPNKEILKTALGATETVSWEYVEDAQKIIKLLKANKAKVFALEQTQNSISLENFDFKNSYPIALILGNEVDGVQQELINLCDGCIEIPQFGSKHSLNVAVSAGIAIWHLACQQLQHGLIFESGASKDE
jgi:23S rRNA (guanosine2251-2'-O)-methyltransferase